jgi:Asp-tRNA(Asn)/Glu-tRNA(Gln) amidotransferase A subunit family amidase
MSVALTWAFNISGHPAISLPAGTTPAGEPVGLHLTARRHREADLPAVAAAAETYTPTLPSNDDQGSPGWNLRPSRQVPTSYGTQCARYR